MSPYTFIFVAMIKVNLCQMPVCVSDGWRKKIVVRLSQPNESRTENTFETGTGKLFQKGQDRHRTAIECKELSENTKERTTIRWNGIKDFSVNGANYMDS